METVGVTERPILFGAEMIRALLQQKKSQTRRIIKNASGKAYIAKPYPTSKIDWQLYESDHLIVTDSLRCPYGTPGDRLWVREAWQRMRPANLAREVIAYRADLAEWDIVNIGETDQRVENYGGGLARDPGGWKPSIHMPRWASRMLLEVTEVRVQRVQEISEEDALAEGITLDPAFERKWAVPQDPRMTFANLWEHIHGPGSWDRNDWVWAICFKRIAGDI